MSLITITLVETSAYYVGRHLATIGGYFYVQEALPKSFELYMKTRDPALGWSRDDDRARDKSGSLIIPEYPDPERHSPCVSLYGDSFVSAPNVNHKDSWANVLSGLLHCRVANYGVAGYGTDQSLLRYVANGSDESPIVILCHESDDVIRNVNRYRNFISPQHDVPLFKPRFVANNGHLQLVPVPEWSAQQYRRFLQDPSEFLDHEFFVPGVLTVTYLSASLLPIPC